MSKPLPKDQLEIHADMASDEFMSHGARSLALALAKQRVEEMGWIYDEREFRKAFHSKVMEKSGLPILQNPDATSNQD